MAELHKFGQERSEMLKNRVVVGNRNEKNSDELISEPNLDLRAAIKICNMVEE